MAARSAAVLVGLTALLAGCGGDRETAQAPPALDGVEQRIGPDGLTEHLAALQRIAGEHDGNRSVGTPGERATADHIAGRLRAAGYRVRVQPVPVAQFEERRGPRLTVGGRGREVRTLRFSGRGTATGVVRATGNGCSRAALRPLRRGEVALIRRGGCSFRAKALAAQRAGASAVLISDREVLQGSLERPGVRIPVVSVARDGAGLAGRRVRLRVDAVTRTLRSRNVIAEAGAERAPRVVMAGGHLDSVGAGPGLNDNGSGVAALLEIAEELGGRALPEGTALRFGFWGAEEVGLVGSTRYVESLPAAERRRISAYVNLDMVGSPEGRIAVYGADATIAAALRRQVGEDAPTTTLGTSSDHAPFQRAGIPVGGLFTGLDRCYHRACDTIDNVDRDVLTRSARGAGAALVELVRR